MSLKDIFLALEREAKNQNTETLARADSEAKELIAEANVAGGAIIAEELDQAKNQLRAKEAKIILEAKFKAKKRLVETKEKLVDGVFSEARQELNALPQSTSYPEIFTGLLLEAAQAIGDQEQVIVKVSKKDVPLAHSVFTKSKFNWTIQPSEDGLVGTVIASMDGRKVLTNTLASRLKRAETRLRDKVGAVLFDQ